MRWPGLILALAGGVIVLAGMALALRSLVGLYEGALVDPLGQGEGAEADASDGMIRGVIVGVAGLPLLLAGTVMLKAASIRRVRRLAERTRGLSGGRASNRARP